MKALTKKELTTIIGGIVALAIFIPIFTTTMREDSSPPHRNQQFEAGFSDGSIAGRTDAIEKTGKQTWEQLDRKAKALSSDGEYQKGWRSGYNAGFEESKR